MDLKDQYGKILLIGVALLLAFVAYQRSHTHDPVVTSVDSASTNSAVLSQDEVENIVKEYIIAHPEVVIESIEKMQKRKIQEMQAKTSVILKNVKGELENDKISPKLGDGSVTVMMIYDYNCNYCKKANKVLDKILQTNDDVTVIYKPYPILSESSEYMTKVILAVNKLYPDQFKPVHSAFMEQKIDSRDDVIKILENYKVSVENVEAEFENADIKDSLTKLGRIAASLKIQGVPVFIIGDDLYPGMLEEQNLVEIIAKNLPVKKEEPKAPAVQPAAPPAPVAAPVPAEVKGPAPVAPAEAPAPAPAKEKEAEAPAPAPAKEDPAAPEEKSGAPDAPAAPTKEDPAAAPTDLTLPPLEELEAPKDAAPSGDKASAEKPIVAPSPSESAEAVQKEQKEVRDQLSEEFSKFMNENAVEEAPAPQVKK